MVPITYWSYLVLEMSFRSSWSAQPEIPFIGPIIPPWRKSPTKRTGSRADSPLSTWSWWVAALVFFCLYSNLRVIPTMKTIYSPWWRTPIKTTLSRVVSPSSYWSYLAPGMPICSSYSSQRTIPFLSGRLYLPDERALPKKKQKKNSVMCRFLVVNLVMEGACDGLLPPLHQVNGDFHHKTLVSPWWRAPAKQRCYVRNARHW